MGKRKEKEEDYGAALQERHDRWVHIYEHGGSDPFYEDGGSLNLVRNHILYYRSKIEENPTLLGYPDAYYKEIPPEMDPKYMARPDEIRAAARIALARYKADPNYQYLLEHRDDYTKRTRDRLSVDNVIGYATGLEYYIKEDRLVDMRRHEHCEHYLESFKDTVRKMQQTPPEIAQRSLYSAIAAAENANDDGLDFDDVDDDIGSVQIQETYWNIISYAIGDDDKQKPLVLAQSQKSGNFVVFEKEGTDGDLAIGDDVRLSMKRPGVMYATSKENAWELYDRLKDGRISPEDIFAKADAKRVEEQAILAEQNADDDEPKMEPNVVEGNRSYAQANFLDTLFPSKSYADMQREEQEAFETRLAGFSFDEKVIARTHPWRINHAEDIVDNDENPIDTYAEIKEIAATRKNLFKSDRYEIWYYEIPSDEWDAEKKEYVDYVGHQLVFRIDNQVIALNFVVKNAYESDIYFPAMCMAYMDKDGNPLPFTMRDAFIEQGLGGLQHGEYRLGKLSKKSVLDFSSIKTTLSKITNYLQAQAAISQDDMASQEPVLDNSLPREEKAEHGEHNKTQTAIPPYAKTLVINLFAGPGAGKTTAALEIAALLKKQGVVTEYVSEYAKELVWAGDMERLKQQREVTAEQFRRLDMLRGKVEVIVTDSPVLLGRIYDKNHTAGLNAEIDSWYNSFDNFNLFIVRGESYEQAGRVENKEQAKEKDREILAMLQSKKLYYGTYSRDSAEKIVQNIVTTLCRIQISDSSPGNSKPVAAIDNIPDELKNRKQWTVFKTYQDKTTGKTKKVIISPIDSSFARSDNPETWASYERAKSYADKYRYKGLVFALDKDLVFIDIDHAIDKETGKVTSPEARRLLTLFPDTYTEKSVSGTGIHILVKGTLPLDAYRRNDSKGIEMYDTRRFVCMTGNVMNDSREIKDYSDKIATIAYDFVGIRPPKKEYAAVPATQSDTDLMGQIEGSRQGAKFNALYRGDISAYPSHSHAESALVFMLAWWTRNPAQIDSIVRSSGLIREKWDSRRGNTTYGGQLIDEALSTIVPREEHVSGGSGQWQEICL